MEENYEKINYRAMGRGTGGVLAFRRRCRIRWDDDDPTPPSIPTKFETVLHKNNREKKGFGQNATRFAVAARTEDRPGPSDYSSAWGSQRPASGYSSRRGCGSFASRAPRRLHSKAQAALPGPGAYEAARPATPKSAREALSAAFKLPGSVNPAKFYPQPSPGPADYTQKHSSGAWSARGPPSQVTARIAPAPDVEWLKEVTPGPGEYDCKASWSKSVARQSLSPGFPGQWAQLAKPMSEAELIRSATSRLLDSESTAAVGSVVGPGEYDPQIEATRGRTCFGTQGSSSFIKGRSHLPRTQRPSTPGPGQYDPLPEELQSAAAKSAFVSGSPRLRRAPSEAPGPAYYSPRKPEPAQSFL
eukprot:CAMPEP_0170571116 /NCGR_PEP_ID=MMETSP0224-20130122/1486_1 /TAXON_ID=285029 /ORGANISM="Togula jolla, Strain CCCM 725" /LENGTH=358 /DNA_ID=CAMNT_0010893467 /DNA_START=24 /DNA_END=1097 /DNA_ORIENTATION=+